MAWIPIGVLLVACGGLVSSSGSPGPGVSGGPGAGGASGSGATGGSSGAGAGGSAGTGATAGAAGSAGAGGGPQCAVGSLPCNGACCSGSCESGRCLQVLASGQHYPEDVAVDATSVYWLDQLGPSCVTKVPLAGGAPVAVTPAKDNVSCAGLAVDSNNAYFIEDNKVMGAPLGGGTPFTLASAQPVNAAGILAIDDTSVYWNNGTSPAGIMKVGLGGGTPQVVAQGSAIANGFAVDATSVYWAEFGSSPFSIVTRTPSSGGPSVPLATTKGVPQTVAVDATSV